MYDKSLPFEATIKWIKKETRDTASYAVKINDRDIQRIYNFKPGQFNMLYFPGVGEAAVSISSGPSDHDLIHTIRVAGDVTTTLSRLNAGDVICLRGPFGKGWPMEEAEDRDLMIIAGGVGIAPLRSVIRHIFTSRKGFTNRVIIFYGAKTPKDVIFRDEFPHYRDVFKVFLTVDKADPEEYWRGDIGVVTSFMGKVSYDPLNITAFICGPEIMMRAAAKELLSKGVPREKIFISMERNMNCGMGICGHCFFGPKFVCKDGPVFRFTDVEEFLEIKEA